MTRSCLFLLALPLAAGSVRIWQTNSAGDVVDVIDPATNKIVLKVKDIEVPHGVAFSPDGKRAYISCESEKTLWAADTKTGKLLGKAPLTGIPITFPFRGTASACSSGSCSSRARWT